MSRSALLFCALYCCIGSGGAAWAQSAVIPLDIELSSTSDRVQLRWQGLSALRTRRIIEVDGPAALDVRGLSLHKPVFDQTPMRWKGRVLVELRHNAPAVELDQGTVGQTRLRITSGRKVLLDVARTPPAGSRRIALNAAALRSLRPQPRRAHERLVLAFYYGWWGRKDGPTGRWRHWRPWRKVMGVPHTPKLGFYDSLDPKIVASHIEQAQRAGIDGFLLSWWGEKEDDPKALKLLLQEAARRRFRIGVYIETTKDGPALATRLAWIIKHFGAHPAFLRADGRPVLMFYDPVHKAVDRIDMRHAVQGLRGYFVAGQSDGKHLALLDAMHVYYIARNPQGHVRGLYTTSAVSRLRDSPVIATVTPGYDDRTERDPGFLQPRAGGAAYDRLWRGAWAADWVLLVSWNEWHEGSQLEPSLEYGERYLDLTRQHRRRWLGEVVGLPLAVTLSWPKSACRTSAATGKCGPEWRLPAPVRNRALASRISELLGGVLEGAAAAGEQPFVVRQILPLQRWSTPWLNGRGDVIRRSSEVVVVVQQAGEPGCMAVQMRLEEPQSGTDKRPRLRVNGFGRPVRCP